MEKVTYSGADGTIDGIIDTPQEAQVMADITRDHRFQSYGYYSELQRDDPKRDGILKAMTIENSLNLARMGSGLAQVVEAIGAFMAIIGLTLAVGGVSVIRSSRQTQ